MTLAALIRKREPGKPANANPAKAANDGRGEGEPLAGLAALALANRTEAKTAIPEQAVAQESAACWCWWLAFSETEHKIVYCHPDATQAEVLERYPSAVAAEPFAPTMRQPSAPMTAGEEAAILAWLALIEETDPATVAEVIGQCRRDAEARAYFIQRAAIEGKCDG